MGSSSSIIGSGITITVGSRLCLVLGLVVSSVGHIPYMGSMPAGSSSFDSLIQDLEDMAWVWNDDDAIFNRFRETTANTEYREAVAVAWYLYQSPKEGQCDIKALDAFNLAAAAFNLHTSEESLPMAPNALASHVDWVGWFVQGRQALWESIHDAPTFNPETTGTAALSVLTSKYNVLLQQLPWLPCPRGGLFPRGPLVDRNSSTSTSLQFLDGRNWESLPHLSSPQAVRLALLLGRFGATSPALALVAPLCEGTGTVTVSDITTSLRTEACAVTALVSLHGADYGLFWKPGHANAVKQFVNDHANTTGKTLRDLLVGRVGAQRQMAKFKNHLPYADLERWLALRGTGAQSFALASTLSITLDRGASLTGEMIHLDEARLSRIRRLFEQIEGWEDILRHAQAQVAVETKAKAAVEMAFTSMGDMERENVISKTDVTEARNAELTGIFVLWSHNRDHVGKTMVLAKTLRHLCESKKPVWRQVAASLRLHVLVHLPSQVSTQWSCEFHIPYECAVGGRSAVASDTRFSVLRIHVRRGASEWLCPAPSATHRRQLLAKGCSNLVQTRTSPENLGPKLLAAQILTGVTISRSRGYK